MVRLITRLVPGMKKRGWGRVIAIASGVATTPFADMANYSATKAANINLAVSLSKALAGTGITSNAVSPGMIMTPGVEEMLKGMAPQLGLSADDLPALEQFAAKNMVPNPSARLGASRTSPPPSRSSSARWRDTSTGPTSAFNGGTVPTVN